MSANPYESPETVGSPAERRINLRKVALRAILVIGVLGLLVALLLPAFPRTAREAARRMQCGNHLKQIGLALQTYHDVYGSLPPAYIADASGKPLHSWRVLILPFLGERSLYEAYRFD